VSETAPPGAPSDLVVVSDLHMGRGYNPASKRWFRLEAFLYDDDFLAFCRWLCVVQRGRGVPLRLVLNGDVLDFLRIDPAPPADARRGGRRPGPLLTPEVAAAMARDVLNGHRAFVEGVAEVLAAGHEVVYVAGNHDLEIQWEPVQQTVRAAVAATLDRRGAPAGAIGRLSFAPWFVHEPGRIWIEHGCQYDPENAFRFPLRRRMAEGPLAEVVAERDMPLGNFFQRYLYNLFGSITFIVPSTRANYRYFRFLLANRPRLLLRLALSHGRFLVQVLRRLGRAPEPGWQREAEEAHRAELADLARTSGLGGRLLEVDRLKCRGADVARAASGLLRQAIKLVFGTILVTLLGVGTLTAATTFIASLTSGVGGKALLSLMVYLVFALMAATGLVAAALRLPTEEQGRPLTAAARRIAGIAGVPLVVFGHIHEEVASAFPLPGGGSGWYFNTGTWLAVFTHDVFLPRERVQFTFLRVRGAEAELLHWSPGRNRPMPVVLLEDDGPGDDGSGLGSDEVAPQG
jgi:UDP-2,3-diacylglucosamine pyrophosphatase LpxH